MAPLLNARHERFAQELAKGKTQSEAYLNAGYRGDEIAAASSANRLLRNDKICERISELQQNGAKRAEVTIESLIQEADELLKLGIKLEQVSAAVAAMTAKAKLAGLWIERGENSNQNVNYVVSDQPMTEEEWVAERVTEH